MKKRVHLQIYGRVQGVCYRMYACEEAERLGLTGWVRNRRDGSVEAVAEGEEERLKDFAAWCRNGPPSAHVTDTDTGYSEATSEFNSFAVTY